MLHPLDPLRGYLDRVVAEGDKEKINMLRNIYPLIMGEFGESFDVKKHKERCIAAGYGSRETLDILYPEPAEGYPAPEKTGNHPYDMLANKLRAQGKLPHKEKPE